MKTVVTVCGDPGGARALVPVLQLLASDASVRLSHFAYNEGQGVLQQNGISFQILSGEPSPESALDYLQHQKPDYLLCATSLNRWNWERALLAAARQLSIPSMAVLDFWSNYRKRFTDEADANLVMPDKLAVMDEKARDEAIAEGLPDRNLIITGQPVFDRLCQYKTQFDDSARRQLRETVLVDDDTLLVMFVSQPLAAMHTQHGGAYLGFDEVEVLEKLLASLESIGRKSARSITLLVRPHPRECKENFRWLTSEHVRVLCHTEGDSIKFAIASDLVVGMNSVLLLEACHVGCVVVSIQPGLNVVDSLPSNSIGASHAVYDERIIESELSNCLLNVECRDRLRSNAAQLGSNKCAAANRIAMLVLTDLSAHTALKTGARTF